MSVAWSAQTTLVWLSVRSTTWAARIEGKVFKLLSCLIVPHPSPLLEGFHQYFLILSHDVIDKNGIPSSSGYI